jgi:DNA gyrase subunit A
MARVRADAALLTVSESGLGRRTFLEEYPVRSRGGKGVINYYVKKNGPVAGIKVVDNCDDVILIADNGIVIRTKAEQIAVQSRYGGGVRVMRVGEDSKVVTLARVQNDENEEQPDILLPCAGTEFQKETAGTDEDIREGSQL